MLDERINRSVYISRQIIEAFCRYAKMTCEGVAHHHESALVEYMENHPIEDLNVVIQNRIASDLPSRQEKISMFLLKQDIDFAIGKLDEGDYPEMKRMIVRCLKKGIKIKNPTDEFMDLLEKAVKYV